MTEERIVKTGLQVGDKVITEYGLEFIIVQIKNGEGYVCSPDQVSSFQLGIDAEPPTLIED